MKVGRLVEVSRDWEYRNARQVGFVVSLTNSFILFVDTEYPCADTWVRGPTWIFI